MASSKLTDSLGVEEVGRHHLDGDVDVLQGVGGDQVLADAFGRSEEHTSELQSLMRISYAVFCLKKKKNNTTANTQQANNDTKHAINKIQDSKTHDAIRQYTNEN